MKVLRFIRKSMAVKFLAHEEFPVELRRGEVHLTRISRIALGEIDQEGREEENSKYTKRTIDQYLSQFEYLRTKTKDLFYRLPSYSVNLLDIFRAAFKHSGDFRDGIEGEQSEKNIQKWKDSLRPFVEDQLVVEGFKINDPRITSEFARQSNISLVKFLKNRKVRAEDEQLEILRESLETLRLKLLMDEFENRGNIGGYWMGLAKIKYWEYLKRKGEDAKGMDSLDDEGAKEVVDVDTPESLMEDVETMNERRSLILKIYKAMDQLDERSRILLQMKYVEGKSHEEIAVVLDTTTKSVKTMAFRLRTKIRAMVEEM